MPKVADSAWGEVKDFKLGGEVALEPEGPAGPTAGKGGAVLGAGTEWGLAGEFAERSLFQSAQAGLEVKSKGVVTATSKEISFGAQVDFEGSTTTSELRLDLVKLTPEGFDVLPLTYSAHVEKFLTVPSITVMGQTFKVSFKPSYSFVLAVKWSYVGPKLAPYVVDFLLPLLPVAVAAGTAYELYYAKENGRLISKMIWDVKYESLAMARGLLRDPGFSGDERLVAAHQEGVRAREAWEQNVAPGALQAIVANGLGKAEREVAKRIPVEPLHRQAVDRAKASWKAEHPYRARLFGDSAVPGVFDLVSPPTDLVNDEIRSYVRSKAVVGPG